MDTLFASVRHFSSQTSSSDWMTSHAHTPICGSTVPRLEGQESQTTSLEVVTQEPPAERKVPGWQRW
jgi:hypothetical protein